jgi:hypothetical protein
MKKFVILSSLLMGGIAHAQSGLPNMPSLLNSIPGVAQQAAPKPNYDPCQEPNSYSLAPNNPNPNGCVHTQAPPPETAHKTTI